MKRARVTRHSWLVACDADMNPAEFENNFHVVAPEEASTCRRKGAKGEWIEKSYDNVIACHSVKRNISQMKVVEDFESTPHKAAPFVVERDKEEQECKMSRGCRRCSLVTLEEGCQEEARRKEAEKKRKKRKTAKEDK